MNSFDFEMNLSRLLDDCSSIKDFMEVESAINRRFVLFWLDKIQPRIRKANSRVEFAKLKQRIMGVVLDDKMYSSGFLAEYIQMSLDYEAKKLKERLMEVEQ